MALIIGALLLAFLSSWFLLTGLLLVGTMPETGLAERLLELLFGWGDLTLKDAGQDVQILLQSVQKSSCDVLSSSWTTLASSQEASGSLWKIFEESVSAPSLDALPFSRRLLLESFASDASSTQRLIALLPPSLAKFGPVFALLETSLSKECSDLKKVLSTGDFSSAANSMSSSVHFVCRAAACPVHVD